MSIPFEDSVETEVSGSTVMPTIWYSNGNGTGTEVVGTGNFVKIGDFYIVECGAGSATASGGALSVAFIHSEFRNKTLGNVSGIMKDSGVVYNAWGGNNGDGYALTTLRARQPYPGGTWCFRIY